MRGYTPWRVEAVGKLQESTLMDSKVRIDGNLLVVLAMLTDHDT